MSKSLNKRNLSEQPAMRALLAISLCASMAAFGCTTDRNLGNGDPVVTPGTRSVPTSGTSAGSESEPVPPPMMSSYNGSVQPRIARMSADEAAAIMARQQPRVRILGPVSPGNGSRPYASDQMLPRQQREARYTINSTINSQPTEAITSGAGEPVASSDAAVSFLDTSGVVVGTSGSTSVTAASTIAGSSVASGTNVTNAAAPVIAPSGTAITPTSNAVSAPGSFASVRTLSPTAASVINPPTSISGSPAIAAASTKAGAANSVRVLNTNGRLTITNSGTTRQQ